MINIHRVTSYPSGLSFKSCFAQSFPHSFFREVQRSVSTQIIQDFRSGHIRLFRRTWFLKAFEQHFVFDCLHMKAFALSVQLCNLSIIKPVPIPTFPIPLSLRIKLIDINLFSSFYVNSFYLKRKKSAATRRICKEVITVYRSHKTG